MGLTKRVRFVDGLKYRGGGPMFAWVLHRLTAIGILLFVGLHVTASFFSQETGGEWAIWINTVYMSPWFQIFVAFCVIFHAINGLRIALLDLVPGFLRFQREAIWVEWAVILPIFLLTSFLIVQGIFRGG
jgi:succinate dehydrogenase / fumarate reductase cytochrome b subunit